MREWIRGIVGAWHVYWRAKAAAKGESFDLEVHVRGTVDARSMCRRVADAIATELEGRPAAEPESKENAA